MKAKTETELQQFRRYAEAVGAERYRVTCIKMRSDGSKMTFILDKKDGVTRGFAPDEIERRTSEMQRLQRRGENLYYTPLSDAKHHILIDDMDREKLKRLIDDGYQPAVVLESSPGNYQAIVTVTKLGTAHDKDVGNRLSDHLNRAYGDPKLSGAIHPHRAPGFENRKPKHQRADGSYPEVRLLKAERRECAKALALSQQIDAGYQQKAPAQVQAQVQAPAPAVAHTAAYLQGLAQTQIRAMHALRMHRGAVQGLLLHTEHVHPDEEYDLSRVDSMCAVRMRLTGHSRDAIEAALLLCAAETRTDATAHVWSDYARRTAEHAFSPAATKQIEEKLKQYELMWKGREYEYIEEQLRKGGGAEIDDEIIDDDSLRDS